MLRRMAAVGMLALASLTFAFRFSAPPRTPDDLEAIVAEIDIEPVPTSATSSPIQDDTGTSPPVSHAPRTVVTTTTIPPLPPGVQKLESGFVRFGRGVLQLEVTLELGVITDIEMIRAPSRSNRAKETNLEAHPLLRAEALEIQNYKVHVVSGATETSSGWARALRDALEQADFCVHSKCDLPLK